MDMPDLMMVQALAAVLFGIGVAVVLSRRNIFFVLMGIEVMLNAVNLSFIGFSRLHGGVASLMGQATPLFVVAIAAAEACVGLAMLICIVRGRAGQPGAAALDADSYARMKE